MVNISRRKIIKNLALAAPLGVIGGKSFGEAGRSLGEAAFSIIYDPGRDPELIKLRNGRSPPYTGNHLELTEDKIVVSELGKMFIRNICMGFDAYLKLSPTKCRYSKTV